MSARVVLSQFESVVNRTESLSSRLCTKRVRATRDQLSEFLTLHTRLKAILASFVSGIQRLSSMASPDEEDILLADHVRSAKDFDTLTPPQAHWTASTRERSLNNIISGQVMLSPTLFRDGGTSVALCGE